MTKRFKIVKVNSGFHPVMNVIINGITVQALIDTGANVSCHNLFGEKTIEAYLRIDEIVFQGYLPYYNIPGGYKLIIGSDLLLKTDATIDYKLKELTLRAV